MGLLIFVSLLAHQLLKEKVTFRIVEEINVKELDQQGVFAGYFLACQGYGNSLETYLYSEYSNVKSF